MNDVVHVRDLVKTYGGVPAVDGIGFDVAIGETFGLLGANGAGKTTTLECLLGVSRPDAGSVTIQPDRGAQASRRVAVGRPAPAPVRGAGAHPAS